MNLDGGIEMAKYVMALDAGTTSNRCILFNAKGEMCSVAQREFTQIFPQPGWVEHDAGEIWATQLGVAVEAMNKIGATAEDIRNLVSHIQKTVKEKFDVSLECEIEFVE
jgi:glycerol kinase